MSVRDRRNSKLLDIKSASIDSTARRVLGKSRFSGPTPNELRKKSESNKLRPEQKQNILNEADWMEKRDKRLLAGNKSRKKAMEEMERAKWERENRK